MFTKRHEQELAEIKATTSELVHRFEEIIEQLEHIKQNQDELAAARRPGADSPASSPGRKSEKRRRAEGATSTEGDRAGGAGKGRPRGQGRTAGGRKRRRRAGDSDSTEE